MRSSAARTVPDLAEITMNRRPAPRARGARASTDDRRKGAGAGTLRCQMRPNGFVPPLTARTTMNLRDLQFFSRTEGGAGISPEAARALNLPMPDDVLEQFIIDHGHNPAFLNRYEQLDLYSLSWSKEMIETARIVNCTSKFDSYVQEIAERHACASSLESAIFHSDAGAYWAAHGTWLRPPVFLLDVFPAPDAHHLVEGHTRVGALVGFNQNPRPLVQLSARHECWIGRLGAQPVITDWRQIRKQHPISFKHWLYAGMKEESGRTEIACALVEAEDRMRYTFSVGDAFTDLMRLLENASVPGVTVAQLEKLHIQWKHALES